MVSFRKNFVLILAGVVCLNFFLVYLSFNYLMGQYIQREAENSVNLSVQTLASTVDVVWLDDELTAAEAPEVFLVEAEPLGELEPMAGYHIEFNDDLAEDQDSGQTITISVRTMPAVKSIFATDYVVLDQDNDVVFPDDLSGWQETAELTEDIAMAEDVSFVVSYFTDNEIQFENRQFVRAERGASTIYMSAVPLEAGYRAVAFADTTQIQSFTNMVNLTLCGIMVFSGFAAVLAGIRMSGGMHKTLRDLSGYAEKIGAGNFSVEEHSSKYVELNQLGKSMADMSQKLKLYDEQQKEFFQNASHELRTPLMSIQGYAEGIAQEVFPDIREAAAVIVEESKEMAALVSQLLYISRLDSLASEPEWEMLDLREVLQAASEKTAAAAAAEGKRVELTLGREPVLWEGNQDQLTTAFVNVLDNGLRYAARLVTVELLEISGEGEDGKNKIVVGIADDGGGIDPKDLPHIFDRLYKGRGGNVGLGLSIAEKVVKGHRGKIQAENRPDGGAVFTVTFEL